MAFRGTIQDYRKAAQFRLQDARELQMSPTHDGQRSDSDRRHLRGAMYLAGYAVECLLKAYLVHLTNCQTLEQAMVHLNKRRSNRGLMPTKNIARTAAGHQIAYLVLIADLQSLHPDYRPELWGRVGRWQSSWRYESDLVAPEVAQEFLDDIEVAVNWIQLKIGA